MAFQSALLTKLQQSFIKNMQVHLLSVSIPSFTFLAEVVDKLIAIERKAINRFCSATVLFRVQNNISKPQKVLVPSRGFFSTSEIRMEAVCACYYENGINSLALHPYRFTKIN
jgi:hypothetical protein